LIHNLQTKIVKILKFIIVNLIVIVLLFIFLEGLSGIIFLFHDIASTKSVAERLHTKHDDQLGWINIPNLYIKDMYGPGVYLKINSLGFRNNEDFSIGIPRGKIRIVCSGDSFTLGYGVSNESTWCQQLTAIDDSLETINMGQGGYGIDQAYLWYKRDGRKLDHDIHIFAFITNNFMRMQSDKFLGYGKPVLEIEDGVLIIKGIPVPKRSSLTAWLLRIQWKLKELNSVKLMKRLISSKRYNSAKKNLQQGPNKTRQIVLKVFTDLQQINLQKNSTLVLVYLPTERSYDDQATKAWREFLHDEAVKHNLLLIDLHDELFKLPSHEVEKFFIHKDNTDYLYASGHYTEEGNAYIANLLFKKLLSIPEISDRIHKKKS